MSATRKDPMSHVKQSDDPDTKEPNMGIPSPPPSAFDAHQARFATYWTTRDAAELAHALVDSEDEVSRLQGAQGTP